MNTSWVRKSRRFKANERRFRPSTCVLEERCTPTVGTVAAFGLAPGISTSGGGPGTISIAGLIGESSTAAGATLSISYQVSNAQGQVLASGPLTVQQVLTSADLYSAKATVAITAAPGGTETITLSATDTDSMGVPTVATTSLYLSPTKGLTTLGIGIHESDGDLYAGSGQGHLTVTPQTGGGFLASGVGSFQLASNPNNNEILNASASGAFAFGVGPQGNLGLKITNGSGAFNYGTAAGDATATGGFATAVAGNLNVSLTSKGVISAYAQGTIVFAATIASTSTTNTAPTTFSGRGHHVAVALLADSTGHFKLGLSGQLHLSGYLNTSSTSSVIG